MSGGAASNPMLYKLNEYDSVGDQAVPVSNSRINSPPYRHYQSQQLIDLDHSKYNMIASRFTWKHLQIDYMSIHSHCPWRRQLL